MRTRTQRFEDSGYELEEITYRKPVPGNPKRYCYRYFVRSTYRLDLILIYAEFRGWWTGLIFSGEGFKDREVLGRFETLLELKQAFLARCDEP